MKKKGNFLIFDYALLWDHNKYISFLLHRISMKMINQYDPISCIKVEKETCNICRTCERKHMVETHFNVAVKKGEINSMAQVCCFH